MKYKSNKNINKEDLMSLYTDVGWFVYTNDIDKLVRAITNSTRVISAWENEKLVALIRTVSDGETIVYIQDVLVLKEYKRKGIGKKLIKMILEENKEIRQIVLLTDKQDEVSTAFYENLNFKSCDDGEIVAFRCVKT